MPPVFPPHIQEAVLLWCQYPSTVNYGALTLSSPAFQPSSSTIVSGRHTTHISYTFRRRIQFALCRVQSPLLAASLLISLPVGTKTFQFPTFAILTDPLARSHSGIPGSIPACGSPGHIAACRALHRRESQAIHRILYLSDHFFTSVNSIKLFLRLISKMSVNS